MMLAFKQKRKIIIVYCILPFVILYNCITGREKKKRNILVYFLDCYLKKNCVRTAYKCNKYHTVYKDINVCPV